MRIQLLALLCLTISSCGKNINAPITRIKSASMATFPFTMTTHLKRGSCDLLPITHRMLTFAPILLEQTGFDVFIGTLEIALFNETKTYKAVYRELPGLTNIDQTIFDLNLFGNFHLQKSSTNEADELVLDNLGTINPFVNGENIRFVLTMEMPVNRNTLSPIVDGLVAMKSSEMFDDTCPPII